MYSVRYNGTLSVFLFVVLVGGTLISCSDVERISRRLSSRATHSRENRSPVSTLEGTTVNISPYEASFEIPTEWLSEDARNKNPIGPRENLYISWEQLDQLPNLNGDNEPDAEIMDSVLPFELCAVHVGSKPWGNYLTTDLEARVYVIDQNPVGFRDSLEKQGLERARGVYKTAELKTKQHGGWEGRVMSVLETGEHTLLFKDIEFYYRAFDGKTVVFVFVHQSGWDKTIAEMLDSFRWAATPTK